MTVNLRVLRAIPKLLGLLHQQSFLFHLYNLLPLQQMQYLWHKHRQLEDQTQ